MASTPTPQPTPGQQPGQEPLRARGLASEIASADGVFMYLPGGVHTVRPHLGDGAAEITVAVDPETARVLEASLAEARVRLTPQRPFVDVNHEGREAAAWPERFFWSESPKPGVYLQAELSATGRALIEGRSMRAFSPQFYVDADLPKPLRGQVVRLKPGARGTPSNPARVTGVAAPAIGALTNDPAFRQILPLFATRHPMPNNDKTAELRARKNLLEQEIAALQAQDQTDPTVADALSARQQELAGVTAQIEVEELRARQAELEQAVRAARERDAEEAVRTAVRRGVIPARDTELQAKWRQRCMDDPENISLLASMRGNPALDGRPLTLPRIEVAREDSAAVLRAYQAELDPHRRGVLYAREIAPRIKAGDPLPLRGANSLGTLAGDLVTQRTLELLLIEQPLLGLMATDFSDEPISFGKQVVSRVVGIPSATAYSSTSGYATQDSITTDVSVTIDQHWSVQVQFNANELAGTSRRLFEEIAPAMSYALGKKVVDTALALITAANFSNQTVQAISGFGRATVITLGGALSDRGVPRGRRTLLLNGAYYDALFSDTAIVTLAGFQKPEVITGDEMIPLHGFKVVRTATLPTTGNLTGFAFSPSALVIATRLPNDYASVLPGATGGGISRTVTDPSTGLSAQLVHYVDHQRGAAYARVAMMWGAASGQAAAGQRLVSTAL